MKRLLTSTVSLGDTVESHASLKVEFDALGGDEDSEFEDSSPLRRNDDVETEVDDDVEFESPKGSSMWKKWSRRDGQTENGDVIVTSSPVSSRDNEEFSLNNSASSRIMKHEMRVLDVDEGNATDDNPDRGFGSTDEFKDGDGDITTTDLDMSGEFLGGGVTTGTWCSSAKRENSLSHVFTRMSIVSLICIRRKSFEHATLKYTLKYFEHRYVPTVH